MIDAHPIASAFCVSQAKVDQIFSLTCADVHTGANTYWTVPHTIQLACRAQSSTQVISEMKDDSLWQAFPKFFSCFIERLNHWVFERLFSSLERNAHCSGLNKVGSLQLWWDDTPLFFHTKVLLEGRQAQSGHYVSLSATKMSQFSSALKNKPTLSFSHPSCTPTENTTQLNCSHWWMGDMLSDLCKCLLLTPCSFVIHWRQKATHWHELRSWHKAKRWHELRPWHKKPKYWHELQLWATKQTCGVNYDRGQLSSHETSPYACCCHGYFKWKKNVFCVFSEVILVSMFWTRQQDLSVCGDGKQ